MFRSAHADHANAVSILEHAHVSMLDANDNHAGETRLYNAVCAIQSLFSRDREIYTTC